MMWFRLCILVIGGYKAGQSFDLYEPRFLLYLCCRMVDR